MNIRKIYNALGDEESRYIFSNRLLFSLTGDEGYMERVIKTISGGEEFYRKLEQKDTRKVIFGAGCWGKVLARQYRKYGFECFVDNKATYPWEEKEGLPVISFDEYLEKYKDATVFLGSRLYYSEFLEQLTAHGITQERIVNVGKMIDEMSLHRYFDLPYMPHTETETFVDAGGLDGKTSELFIQWCGGHYKKIYIFEPGKTNIIMCENRISSRGRVEIIPCGLWDKECVLKFTEKANGASYISENADEKEENVTSVSVNALDQLISDDISFIKMDIEGSEYKAIKGAEQIIKRCHPKLAISIYHKLEDIWELPELILDICPDYRLYLRHYSIAQAETVLYAI